MGRRTLLLRITGLVLLGMALGCAGQQVSSDVPLKRVVLYRNGVGYFERAGELDGERLQFSVLREHVGDFLATLTVIDRSGHARSVSFPSLVPPEPDCDLIVNEELGEVTERCDESDEETDLIDVELVLGGGDEHDLTVAYVVETPIWRPSYRVVLEDEEALLQGWAVVQNLSGEDWTDVEMSVTSGAPLSFRADLGEPVIPTRPLVSDRGEVVAAPVYSETALRTSDSDDDMRDMDESEEAEPPPPPSVTTTPVPRPAPSRRSRSRSYRERTSTRTGGSLGRRGGGDVNMALGGAVADSTPGGLREEAARQDIGVQGLLGSVGSLAAGAVHEGVTRYDVADRVTVPDNGSTMVAIINQTVTGEDALLYRPQAAVPGSSTYPMRVVRLKNSTGVLLERGPVAIFQTGALLGQGLMEPLPDGATTSIPFAIERAVAVEVAQRNKQSTGRLIKIASGRLTIEQFSQRSTTYRIRNGLDRSTQLYLRHGRIANWEIVDPPEGMEEVEQAVLLPVELETGDNTEFEVMERTPTRRVVDLFSDIGAQAVLLYLQGAAIDVAAGPVLRQAMEHRDRLNAIGQARNRLNQERQELLTAQSEVRSNLGAIQRIARARDLRDRLTRRLAELSARIDDLTNQIVELDAESSEMRVRMSESLRDLTLDVESN